MYLKIYENTALSIFRTLWKGYKLSNKYTMNDTTLYHYTVYKEVKDHNSVVKIRSEKYFPQDAMNFCFCCGVWLKKLKTYSVASLAWPCLMYLILLLSVTTVGFVLFMQMSFGHNKMVFGMVNGFAVLLTIVETPSK